MERLGTDSPRFLTNDFIFRNLIMLSYYDLSEIVVATKIDNLPRFLFALVKQYKYLKKPEK